MTNNKILCGIACKGEKLIEQTVLRQLFDAGNTLKDRAYMYIFLFSATSLGMAMVGEKMINS